MRGWNKSETSRHFLVSDDTIRDWLRRVDDDALVQTPAPVNRFPDVVRYAVQQIRLFCPTLGKLKIAEQLARAGIHIGKSTVERILKERPVEPPHPTDENRDQQVRIVSKYSGHTWNADLTAVPISGGFWTPWIPTLDSHCDLPTLARLLVGAQCDRSFLAAVPGMWRLPEAAHLHRGYGRVGSHHLVGKRTSQTLDC